MAYVSPSGLDLDPVFLCPFVDDDDETRGESPWEQPSFKTFSDTSHRAMVGALQGVRQAGTRQKFPSKVGLLSPQ